jgi:hypothetical protein
MENFFGKVLNFVNFSGGTVKSNEIPDETFIKEIMATKLLAPLSKKTYTKNLLKITKLFFDKQVSIHWVIHHPDEFKIACEKYGQENKLQPASLAQYMVPIMYCLVAHRELQEANPKLKYKWARIRDEIREPDDAYEKENRATTKQEKAFMPFDEICKIRDKLPDGSMGKLLLSMYTMIEPVRSDFDTTRIYDEEPNDDNGNYIVLGKIKSLYLNKYKTSERYGKTIIKLPDELITQIKESLKKNPRDYLFKPLHGETFNSNTFNKWANRTLKNILNNESFTLTMLRHSYLSQPKLDLENKSMGERREIADKMLHSVGVQKIYPLKIKSK